MLSRLWNKFFFLNKTRQSVDILDRFTLEQGPIWYVAEFLNFDAFSFLYNFVDGPDLFYVRLDVANSFLEMYVLIHKVMEWMID